MRTQKVSAVGGMALALTLCVGAGSVQASPVSTATAQQPVKAQKAGVDDARGEASVVKSYNETPALATQKAKYWTPERMRTAIPVDQAVRGGKETALTAVPTGAQSTTKFNLPRWAGKVFFTVDGDNYVCSASTSRTKRRDIVVTAGHCVTLQGTWSRNVVYVPKYRNGNAPLGVWTTNKIATYRSWARRNVMSRDMAFLQMNKLNGKKVQAVTGGQPIREGWKRRQSGVRIIGWPAEGRFNGEVARQCTGPVTPYASNNYDAKMFCDMNGGASGGPWHRRARGDSGHMIPGGVFAVTSRRTTSGPKRLLATPFPKGFRDLIQRF